MVFLTTSLGACALAHEPIPRYGPEVPMNGIYWSNFEVSQFQGCDTEFALDAFRQMNAMVGEHDGRDGRNVQLVAVGMRSLGNRKPGHGYGLMGYAPCRITITRVFSARLRPQP